jgi:hypothetical protein
MSLQELINRFTCAELFENQLNSDSRSGNDRFPHHDFRIRRDEEGIHAADFTSAGRSQEGLKAGEGNRRERIQISGLMHPSRVTFLDAGNRQVTDMRQVS